MTEEIHIGIFGDASLPTLVYLPGLHGDWTLITGFRAAVANRIRLVEVTYPRSLDWSVEDYANAIEFALLARGIKQGWLLGESWGSQPAWALIGKNLDPDSSVEHFKVQGLFLAGGFVKHPLKWGPAVLNWLGAHKPKRWYQFEIKLFGWYARVRHRRNPVTLYALKEFAARRTEPDRLAMQQRLGLLDDYDPRPIARQTRLPVHYLAGAIDPLVPWVLVRHWLGRNCPGYRGGKTFWLADHNILATSPVRSANSIIASINTAGQ